MYRQQYAEAANLFANVRRPYRPTPWQEWRRTWLISCIGVAMVIGAFGFVILNEGRAVRTTRSLEEGHRKIVIPETNDVVFDENNGKLVLVADYLKVPDALVASEYGISIRAVKLKKTVQMYQWYEIEDSKSAAAPGDHDDHAGGHASYSYATDWIDHSVDSEQFYNSLGHHNPETWPMNSSIVMNSRVKVGDFLLGKDLREKFNEFKVFTSDERPSDASIKMHAGLYYHAADVWRPEVGDVRIQFGYAGRDEDRVTIVGKQSGRELRPYETESGDELLLLYNGFRRAEDIFHHEHVQNRMQTWLCRAVGWLIAFLGFTCLASVLDAMIDDHPAVRGPLTLGFANMQFSFALITTLLATASGWIMYRPVLGVILIALAGGPLIVTVFKNYRRWQVESRHRL